MTGYLDALKQKLTGMDRHDPSHIGVWDPDLRVNGYDWPSTAVTMVGLRRLDHLQQCVETVLAEDVPGDLIETGVWRGGSCILMRAVLAAHGVTDRVVWVADSFQGMPGARDPDEQWTFPELAVPQEQVEANFRDYGLLDEQVRFLPGWFDETLPGPVGPLAVLRLDGDYYSSTMDVLNALYPKLSPGGFCVIDDWTLPRCQQAVLDYRAEHDVTDPALAIDNVSVFWRKS